MEGGNTTYIILSIGAIIFAGHIFSAIFEKFKVPDILLLVFLGILLGPVLNLVSPEEWGKVGVVFSKIALVMILFEAGIDVELKEFSKALRKIALFSFSSLLLTFASLFLIFLSVPSLTLPEKVVLSFALLAPAPSVVLPMIRGISAEQKQKYAVIVDSIVAEIVAVLGFSIFLDVFEKGFPYIKVFSHVVFGILLGIVSGIFWTFALRIVRKVKYNLFTTLAFSLCIWALAEMIGVSGVVAVFTFSLFLANVESLGKFSGFLARFSEKMSRESVQENPLRPTKSEIDFFFEIIFLIKVFFFVYMGTVLKVSGFKPFAIAFLATFTIIMVRAILNFLTLKLDIVNIFIPRGLVSVALIFIAKEKMEISLLSEEIVYVVIILTILWSSLLTFVSQKFGRQSES